MSGKNIKRKKINKIRIKKKMKHKMTKDKKKIIN